MPLFVSHSANLRVPIQSRKAMYTPKGDVSHHTRRIVAKFTPGGGLPVWAKEQAVANLSWRGLSLEESPGDRIGWFDSDQYAREAGLTAEDKATLDATLIRMQGPDILMVSQPKIEAPWKSYAELTVVGRRTPELLAEKVVELVRATGTDPDHVIRFERENPRAGSEEIVAAMEALKATPQEEDAGPPLVAA